MSELERYTVTMPGELLASFDRHIAAKGYRNRSEALRDLVRQALVEEAAADPRRRVAASLTIVYDHHTRELTDKLTAIQHEHGSLIVSAMHVHLDHDNCLEVIVMRGPAGKLQALADAVGSVRGVKHTQLAFTTEGHDLM